MTRLLCLALALLWTSCASAQGINNPGYPVGQIPGTATNDNAAAGDVGEIISSLGNQGNATVTISNASPAVISDATACAVNQRSGCVGIGNVENFTTTGGLPTGLSVGTNYYVLAAGFTPGTSYEVALTEGGTAVNTSSAGTGTQTRVNTAIMTNGSLIAVAAASLTAGDWGCSAEVRLFTTGTTTSFQGLISTVASSNSGVILESNIGQALGTGILLGINYYSTIAPVPILLSGNATYYLNVVESFSTGAGSGSGSLICRRAR